MPLLKVTWQSQLDNGPTGYRECFSSSAAMLAMFHGKVRNDDEYNLVRRKFGDTTDPQAQLRALRELGLDANFRTNGTPFHLMHEIDCGRPVAVGWLHKGHVSDPVGGGHWSVVIGYNPTHWIMNDPNGDPDLVNGGYLPSINGAGLLYSRENWNPRWMVHGTGGWMLTCNKRQR